LAQTVNIHESFIGEISLSPFERYKNEGYAVAWDYHRAYLAECYDKRWCSVEKMMEKVQMDSWMKFEDYLREYFRNSSNKEQFLILKRSKFNTELENLISAKQLNASNNSYNSMYDNNNELEDTSFLYFSREKWHRLNKNKQADNALKRSEMEKEAVFDTPEQFYYKYLHRLAVGCPKSCCLRVWKS